MDKDESMAEADSRLEESRRMLEKIMRDGPYYNRSTDSETESPKHLLSELSELQQNLESTGPTKIWHKYKRKLFEKLSMLQLQLKEQNDETEPALLFTADETADIKEAAKLTRVIKKRVTELNKLKRQVEGL